MTNEARQKLTVLPRECTVNSKHPLPITQETTLHMSITRWSILKSDWLYSLQPKIEKLYQFSLLQLISRVQLIVIPWTAARQVSLFITNSLNLLKLMSIELVIPSNHLILYCPFFLSPSIFPSIRVFSSKSVLCIRWPKYWSFSFSISPSNEYSGLALVLLYFALPASWEICMQVKK